MIILISRISPISKTPATNEEPNPIQNRLVTEPHEYPDDELPSKFLVFACPDLDQNEGKAREAGEEIQDILCDIIDSVCDLEDIERALRDAEPASARARRAREQLLRALSETEGLIVGVGNAHDALIVRWNATTTPVSP